MRFAILNAFVDQPMSGNPAAVCFLEDWLSDDVLLQVAKQFGYSETAFVVEEDNQLSLRWFTPKTEVDLCGHATIAAAFMVFEAERKRFELVFQTRSGLLTVTREGQQLAMDFPIRRLSQFNELETLEKCLGTEVVEAVVAGPTVLALVKDQSTVEKIQPNLEEISALSLNAVIPTASGEEVDFVSRFFGPRIGIPEDPVTGAAHTGLAPYWAGKLSRNRLSARQLSERGGKLFCDVRDDRVILSGRVQIFAEGNFNLPL